MKTTIEIPDAVFRQVKARAALRGRTLRSFVLDAIRDKLETDAKAARQSGWRAAFGKASAAHVAGVQETIDAEFATIRPEDWA